MNIILIKDVDNLGYIDDLVTVKSGYARNYLIPNRMAVVANETNKKQLDFRLKKKAEKEAEILSQINIVKEKLQATTLKIGAKVGTTEKIFGSVSNHHIASAIKDQTGFEIDRRKITIKDGEVKTLGEYQAELKLQEDQVFDINFEVIAE